MSIPEFIQGRTDEELRQLNTLFKRPRIMDVYLALRNGPMKVKDLDRELSTSTATINLALYDLRKAKLISVVAYEEHEPKPCGCMSTGPRFKIWGLRS